MIRYTQGNLLDAPSDALVNTVNEDGVMGKGIALMFREAFPESARVYEQAAKRGEVRVGHVLVTQHKALFGPRWIIHFPTKRHWRYPSKLEWVRQGLQDLKRVVPEHGIRSIGLPPLGCGNGGLEWSQVRREIEAALGDLENIEITVYEPTVEYVKWLPSIGSSTSSMLNPTCRRSSTPSRPGQEDPPQDEGSCDSSTTAFKTVRS